MFRCSIKTCFFNNSMSAWLNLSGVKSWSVALFKGTSSIILSWLILFGVFFLIGYMIILPCISSCRCSFLRRQRSISFKGSTGNATVTILFRVFCIYRNLDSYKQCEPTYKINYTGLFCGFCNSSVRSQARTVSNHCIKSMYKIPPFWKRVAIKNKPTKKIPFT